MTLSSANVPLPVNASSAPGLPPKFSTMAFDNTAAGNNPLYIGYCTPGTLDSDTAWAIKKITYDGNNNPTRFQWANVVSALITSNLVWTNRASYTYS